MKSEKSKNSLWNDAIRRIRRDRVAMVSFAIIILYLVTAVSTQLGFFATDFEVVNYDNAYKAPSAEFWAGTDIFGRNVLSRGIHGIVTALSVGFFASLIAVVIGIILGSIAGYFGGFIDDLIVWLYTTFDSIPYLLFMMALALALGPGTENLFIAIGITSWVTLCRLVRGEVMKHKNQEYVQAAKAIGASHYRRIFIHILPNVFHIALIQFSLLFVYAIKIEVILTYLGLGVEPGTPSWGAMIDDAKLELSRGVWWGAATATFFMFWLILAMSLFNDALREALDPKLRGKG